LATRIFETDPDAQPRERKSFTKPDIDFYFRAGMQVEDERGRKLPQQLTEWRVTTGDPAIADAVAQLYGGAPEEWDTPKDDAMQVLTRAGSIRVVLSGSGAIADKLVQWGRKGPIHECDGMYSLLDRDFGQPCGCPELLADRKAAARDEAGPAPYIQTTFRLADDYELGTGQLTSTSWDLLVSLYAVRDALDAVNGEALCELALEHVNYTTKKTKRVVDYHKPVITVLGSWNDAIGEAA
jgi:hypothetical protein